MNAFEINVMRRMINPAGLAANETTSAAPPEQLQRKRDAEAVADWEDEGGASGHPGESAVVRDLPLVRRNEVKKGATCI